MIDALLDRYYDALVGPAGFDPIALRALLADDLLFRGPIAGEVTGADRFVRGVAGFATNAARVTMLQRVVAANAAATVYDAALPAGVVRFAEFFTVADDRIAALTIVYPAAEYVAAGGR